eukprot:Skav234593  [mRNA]  locus=scaffold540:11169:15482:- [translate_table: standard]
MLGLLQQELAEPMPSGGNRSKARSSDSDAVDAVSVLCEVPETWLPPADANTGSNLRLAAEAPHGSTAAGGLERSELGLEVSLECGVLVTFLAVPPDFLGLNFVRICAGNCGSETLAAGANFRTAMFAGAGVALNCNSWQLFHGSNSTDKDLWGSCPSSDPAVLAKDTDQQFQPPMLPQKISDFVCSTDLRLGGHGVDQGILWRRWAVAGGAGDAMRAASPVSVVVLSDLALAHELQLSSQEAEAEANKLSSEHLEERWRQMDLSTEGIT